MGILANLRQRADDAGLQIFANVATPAEHNQRLRELAEKFAGTRTSES